MSRITWHLSNDAIQVVVVVKDGKIVEAPRLVAWAKGKSFEDLKTWMAKGRNFKQQKV